MLNPPPGLGRKVKGLQLAPATSNHRAEQYWLQAPFSSDSSEKVPKFLQ